MKGDCGHYHILIYDNAKGKCDPWIRLLACFQSQELFENRCNPPPGRSIPQGRNGNDGWKRILCVGKDHGTIGGKGRVDQDVAPALDRRGTLGVAAEGEAALLQKDRLFLDTAG